ncbi:hypothetical protein K8R78_01735 [bacterium]|nr:hypothetical protein [bacterium]
MLIGLIALALIIILVLFQRDELIGEMLHESFNATLATARYEEPAAAAVLRLLVLRIPADTVERDLYEVATLIDQSVADGLVDNQEAGHLSLVLRLLAK